MSGSLRPTEIHKRRHRKEKRRKLRAKLTNAPAHERSTLETKLQKTYPLAATDRPQAK